MSGAPSGGFAGRNRVHDAAIAHAASVFTRFGLISGGFGVEHDDSLIREALRERDDPGSLMLRYRPDQEVVGPESGAFLAEIKSKPWDRPGEVPDGFAVEWQSWLAATHWNQTIRTCFVFVAVERRSARPLLAWGCWAKDVPPPRGVIVPKRMGAVQAEAVARVEQQARERGLDVTVWPGVPSAGSGTPYLTVPRGVFAHRSLPVFIATEVRPVVPAPVVAVPPRPQTAPAAVAGEYVKPRLF